MHQPLPNALHLDGPLRARVLHARRRRQGPVLVRTRRRLGLVLAVLLASAFLRLYQLDTIPPGIPGDIAYNGLDGQAILAGHPAIFFPANHGREALFIWFQALLMALAGKQPIVFAWSAAAMGMLTVAAACRFFAALFGWRAGILAAALLAGSWWSLAFSRIGLRTVMVAPLLLAALYCLWRLLGTGRRRYAVLAGVAIGLSLYTYLSARLIPLLVVLLCLVEWRRARKQAAGLAVTVLVALAVFAPEGVYFARHFGDFLQRAGEVSVFNPSPQIYGAPSTPARSILRTLGMFFAQGDDNPQHNIPGLPVFDPWLAALFVAGVGLVVWRARRSARWPWPLVTLLVMLVPSGLSHTAPDLLQALAAAPAAFAFPALALDSLMSLAPWTAWLAGAVVLLSAGVSADRLFRQWGPDPAIQSLFGVSDARLAAAVNGREESRVYVAYPFDDTLASFRLAARPSLESGWIPAESAAVPLPAEPRDVLYVAAPDAAIRQLGPGVVPGFERAGMTADPAGQPAFFLFRLPGPNVAAFLRAQKPVGLAMGADLRLVSYEAVSPPGKLVVNVIWQQLRPKGPYDLNIHLLGADGRIVAQSDRTVWPVEKLPGSASHDLGAVLSDDDLLLTQHSFDAPPGAYTLEIGAVHLGVKNPWTAGAPTSGPVGDVARIPVTVNG